jgi:glyoxylate/hydroxypyruvate reductase
MHTEHILLRIRGTPAECSRWQDALRAAMPHVVWHAEDPVDPAITQQIQVAVVANPAPGSLQGFSNLKLVQSLWAGVDGLLADTSIPEHLVIARMVDPAMSAAMAQTALWATLSLHRCFFQYAQQQQHTVWKALPQKKASDIHVAILGAGAMGSAAAASISAQGYPVSTWRTTDAQHLHALLGKSQVVINLLPLTTQTRNLLNHEFFAAMPKGAGIVNLARGGHLVEKDLINALASGQVGHAVLDVFHAEPLAADHVFWRHPNITVLPHVAAITDPVSASQIVARQLKAWAAGQAIDYRVDRTRGY